MGLIWICDNKSCSTNLLEYFEVVIIRTQKRKVVDVVHWDFHELFNKMPHMLLDKAGVQGNGGNILM